MGSGWREDEGRVESPPAARDSAPPAIWREGEGQPQTDTAGLASEATRDPWRVDEGSAIPRTAAPVAVSQSRAVSLSSRSRLRRPSTYLLLLVGLALLGLIGDGAYVAARLSSSLGSVQENLRAGRVALERGDVDGARALFEDASERAAIAKAAAGHPSLWLAELLPRIGTDAEALRALARAAELGTEGALAGADAAEALGLNGQTFAQGVYEDGEVDLDALVEAQPYVASAAESLGRAAEVLAVARQPTTAQLRDALVDARTSIDTAAGYAANGNALMSALPGLLGGDGERRYLLAFQARGEARGTGGVVGLYGLLRASDGRLTLEKVASFQDIQQNLTEPVDAPAWYARSYGPQNAREEWAQANLTPNFTAAARVMINMYEAAIGKDLDGAIAMDPLTFSDLLTATGPIADPETGEPISEEKIGDVLLRDSYTRFSDSDEQNLFLGRLIRSFWDVIQSGDVGPEIAPAIAETVRNGHLKVYTSDPDERAAMAALGADGNFVSLGPATQLVFSNNYSVNKVDYYSQRTVDTTVELDVEGGATFTTRIEVENRAPSEPPSILIGQGREGLPPGTNRMVLAAALPLGAEVDRAERGGEILLTPFTYRDSGRLVVWDLLTVAPGDSEELTFVYSIEGPPLGSVGGLTVTLAPQTTVNPDRFSFELVPPAGSRVTAAIGAVVRGEGAVAGGELTEPRLMSFIVRRTDA